MYWSTWSSVTGDLALSLTEVLGEAGMKFQVELNTWWDQKVTSVHLSDPSFLGQLYLDM